LSDDREELQKGLIITDNFSKLPILDFDSYTNAIVKMIKNSYPNFTIGIYGDWGTGKTTLMKSIEKQFEGNEENILTVWFDAWKYENEKQFALIPLLKVISYSIKDGDNEKRKLKDALKETAIFTVGLSTDIVSSLVSNYAGKEMGGLLKRSLEAATNKLIPQLKKLSEIDSNSIFYNGIKNIQEAIDGLRLRKGGFKIIIFVDDLDRCSENKILQILESIKIFLSLNGIIYVLGISHDRVVELINKKYQTKNGEDYLKKFVQIPLTLTDWNAEEIEKLIDHLLEKDIIDDDYKPIIRENKKLIASSMEENPREIKRFLNNLIISYEVFSHVQQITEEAKRKFLKQLLLVQILKSNWKLAYRSIMDSEGAVLLKLKDYIPLDNAKAEQLLKEESTEQQLKIIFEQYKNDERLWNLFDENNYDMLVETPWKNFRRALKFTEEMPSSQEAKVVKSILEISRILNEFQVFITTLKDVIRDLPEKERADLLPFLDKFSSIEDKISISMDRLKVTGDPLIIAETARLMPVFIFNLRSTLSELKSLSPKSRKRLEVLRDQLDILAKQIKKSGRLIEISGIGDF